jgi:formylglycine-generating enzyme required for sulfatase activity/cephalosporin-C deacetylase-like acetyl esterase
MGEVYRAEDTILGRQVAIKVLPDEFAHDAERLARFEREAKLLASLNHPNIAAIHGLEQADGKPFLVLELVEGETLAKRIARGPLAVDEALNVCCRIAEGLEAAHDKGIIHRDLKPANVNVTPEGKVKILDFGLARALHDPISAADFSHSSTVTEEMTRPGVVLGTAAYMSPEQAAGKPVDARSDIFSFGSVLYEMLSGRPAFKGDSALLTLAAVMHEPPPPLKIRSDIPPALRRIMLRCLEKNRDMRPASGRELLEEIKTCQAGMAAWRLRSKLLLPRYAVPALVVLLAILSAAVWVGLRLSRARWAHNVATPQIEKLVDSEDRYAAYQLIRQAERYLPGDSHLQSLWQRATVEVSVLTTPPGAEIYIADARGAQDSGWELLGKSPLEKVRIPNAMVRWKVVMQGYESIEVASAASWPRQFPLQPQGTIPPGMVYIPGGRYAFGSLAPVVLEAYWLDKYEVTNKQFKEFVSAGGYQKREYWKHPFLKDSQALSWEAAMAEFRDATGRPGPASWKFGTYPEGQGDFPVGGVSWYEAAAYAVFAGKSLPTLYHWQNAAGIMGIVFPVAAQSNMDGSVPARVGSFRSLGAYGTYDLAGNVKEWCWNQIGSNRYLLGGAWSDPLYMFAEANHMPPFDRSATNGFRCAKYKGPLPETMTAPIQQPVRDFSKEKPVSDHEFQLYKRFYAYDRSELKAVVEAVDDSSKDWRKEKISFNAAYGNERVVAYLFLPKNYSPPYQTVVYFPGSWARRLRSSSDLFVSYLDFIVNSGRAVLHPIYKGTYERGVNTSSSGNNFGGVKISTLSDRDLVIAWSKDLGRSIDYLETRKDIDSKKLAYYGLSSGGVWGPVLTAIEERFKASVLLAGGMYLSKVVPEVDAINFAPRATIPVLMLNGQYDYAFPQETAQDPLFRILGAPDKDKRHIVIPGSGHMPPRKDVEREIVLWLDKYLGPVSSK